MWLVDSLRKNVLTILGEGRLYLKNTHFLSV